MALPTTDQEQAWLAERLVQYRADAADWDAKRDALDTDVIRPLRPLFRDLLLKIVNETTGQAKADAQHALDVLAAPGPAHSVAKDLHTATRRFGDEALHTLNHHIADIEARLAGPGR
ncbi:MAG: hypothetical protein ACRDMH_15150 [Solirubrobacterales bacterium]